MIADLKPYPVMKDSGVPGLGAVPEHWKVRRQRGAVEMRVSNVDKHTKEGEQPVRLCNYSDAYKNDRITERLIFMRASATQDEIERFRLEVGDVLITKDSETWNDIGVPALVEHTAPDLICGYHLALLRPKPGVVQGSYLFRALQSNPVAYQYHVAATGVTRYGLSHDAIKSVFLPLPPLPEQAAIVRFLDYVDRRIRRYIAAKQKLIKLLEEQKQVIVHRAVTRGLDPHVDLKPSGVEWLGDMPEHWEVAALRRYWSVVDCKHLTVPFVGDGIPVASVREVQSFDLRLDKAKRTTEEWYRRMIEGGRAPRRGDLIYCRNVSVGAVALVASDERFAMGQDVCLIRSNHQNQRYLNYFLHSPSMSRQLAMGRIGSTFDRINVSEIKALIIIVPPREEQDDIVRYLDGALISIERSIASVHREIALLREYRTRLIADVVTGKLDVREAAARLPDETDEPELLDETEVLADGDEEGDGADADAALAEVEA
jgi:type I restriction enzyme, S subunit